MSRKRSRLAQLSVISSQVRPDTKIRLEPLMAAQLKKVPLRCSRQSWGNLPASVFDSLVISSCYRQRPTSGCHAVKLRMTEFRLSASTLDLITASGLGTFWLLDSKLGQFGATRRKRVSIAWKPLPQTNVSESPALSDGTSSSSVSQKLGQSSSPLQPSSGCATGVDLDKLLEPRAKVIG